MELKEDPTKWVHLPPSAQHYFAMLNDNWSLPVKCAESWKEDVYDGWIKKFFRTLRLKLFKNNSN